MFTNDSYDSLASESNVSIKPLWMIEDYDQVGKTKDLVNWFDQTHAALSNLYQSFFLSYYENLTVYTARHRYNVPRVWMNTDYQDYTTASNRPTSQRSRVNLLQKMIETHVSRLTSSRAMVAVNPADSNSWNAKSAAKSSERVLKTIARSRQIDELVTKTTRTMLICGEAWILAFWNPELGAFDPQLQSKQVPLLDEQGLPKKDEKGNPVFLRSDTRIGDIDYKPLLPFQVLPQPGSYNQDETDWVLVRDMVDIYKLRQKYPQFAEDIKPNRSTDWASRLPKDKGGHMEDRVQLNTLYHRSTSQLPNGRLIICTPDIILENTDLPYPSLNKERELPLIRLTDVDVPGIDRGVALTVMESGKYLQDTINRMTNVILRNFSASAPKWLVAGNSVSKELLGNNAPSVVSYRGSLEPKFVSPPSTPQEFFLFRDQLIKDLEKTTGVFPVSMGDAPPNTRAEKMLAFHEEQEFKLAEPLIKKQNDAVRRLFKITLSIVADRYDDSDGRLAQIIGKSGAPYLIPFKSSDLSGEYTIDVQRTSALPESREGKIDYAIRLKQAFPALWSDEQALEAIDLGATEEMVTTATAARDLATMENELLSTGDAIPDPEKCQDHFVHLKAHYPLINSISYQQLPDPLRKIIELHVTAHEMFLWSQATANPNIAVRLAELPLFPAFLSAPAPTPISAQNPVPAPQMQGTARPQQGGVASPSGESGSVPGV